MTSRLLTRALRLGCVGAVALGLAGAVHDAAAAGPRGGFAVVDSAGHFTRGKNVVRTTQRGTGVYEVVFNNDVRACAYTATLGDPGNFSFQPSGEIGVGGNFTSTSVLVATYDSAGTPTNLAFHLHVAC